jgi:hypothetical protein
MTHALYAHMNKKEKKKESHWLISSSGASALPSTFQLSFHFAFPVTPSSNLSWSSPDSFNI